MNRLHIRLTELKVSIFHLSKYRRLFKNLIERVSVLAYKAGRCLLLPLLKERSMTQIELANKLGVTKQQVNKYVHNKQMMSIEVALNISLILKCHMEDLYEWVKVGRTG